MRKLSIAAVIAALALALVPNVSQAATPPQTNPDELAVATTQPAVVYLEQYWRYYVRVPNYGYINGGRAFTAAFRCSGFLVSPDGYIATAGHCVNPKDFIQNDAAAQAVNYLWDNSTGKTELFRLLLKGIIQGSDTRGVVTQRAADNWQFVGQATGSGPDLTVYAQRGTVTGGQKTGQALPARVINSEQFTQGDVAILKIEASNVPTLHVASTSDLTVGTPIIAVGYPGNVDEVSDTSLDPSFNDGKVNAKKTLGNGLIPAYQVDASMSGGMSGGPVVNSSGDVVGMVHSGTPGTTGGNFNLITTASLINELMSRSGVHNTLSPDDQAWRKGLAMYFKGDGKGAVKQFQSIDDQSRPLLADYLKKAQAVAKTQGGFPMLIVIIAAAVVLLGGGLTAFFVSRKKKTPAAPMPAMAGMPTTEQPYGAQPQAEAPAAAPSAPVISSSSWQAPPQTAAPTPPSTPAAPAAPAAPAPAPAAPATPATPQEPAAKPAQVITATTTPTNGVSSQHYCSKCGTAVTQGMNFCQNCGTKVG